VAAPRLTFFAVALALAVAVPARAMDLPPPGPTEQEPLWAFGLEARMPILKGEPARFNPDVGLGVGVHVQRSFRSWFALRIAVDHDRIFARRTVKFRVEDQFLEVTRSQNVTSTSFLVEPLFRWRWRWLTLHFAVGAGVYVAFYNNAEVEQAKKVDASALLPGLRLESGVSFRLHRSFALGLAFDYNFRRDTTRVPNPGETGGMLRPFDDQMAVSLRFDYLF